MVQQQHLPLNRTVRLEQFNQRGDEFHFQDAGGNLLRLRLLTDDLLRVTFSPSGQDTGNISRVVVGQNWPAVAVEVQQQPDAVLLQTSALQVLVAHAAMQLEVRDQHGRVLSADHPAYGLQWSAERTRVSKLLLADEELIGLGWRPMPTFRRRETSFALRNKPSYSEPDSFYGGVPLLYGLREGHAWALFFDDVSWGRIDVGQTQQDCLRLENCGGPLEYYVFGGPRLAGILDRYTQLTGRPFLPPRWACGYQQCRWSYTPDQEVLEVARALRAHQLPCDVIYLDIDYMPAGTALTFDPETFPNPAGMLAELHDMGFRTVANISPILLDHDPLYQAAEQQGFLLRKADGTTLQGNHFYWKEFAGAPTGNCAWLDFSNPQACLWWEAQHQEFLQLGIDGIWNDLNEPDELGGLWPRDVQYDFAGQSVEHCQTSAQYSLMQTELSCGIMHRANPGRRPYVLSRSFCAGIQRTAVVWTGDNDGDWQHHYQDNVPMGLALSLCGQPHNGHDIGGFFGKPGEDDRPADELYIRWMQAGVFFPFCRQHHDGFGNRKQRAYSEPFRYGQQVQDICREYINLRYRLMPYIYSLFWQAHQTGLPVQRPTLLEFQEDPRTWGQEFEFLFGPFLLVVPVYAAGQQEREVYLPAGTDWYDWWTGCRYAGGAMVTLPAPLERLPLLVRAGAIIPMGPVMQYTDEHPLDCLTVRLYPGDEQTSFQLYEDDGVSCDFQQGTYSLTEFTLAPSASSLTLDISACQGSWQPPDRRIELCLCGLAAAPRTVLLDGEELDRGPSDAVVRADDAGWWADSSGQLVTVRFRDNGSARHVRIIV